jgi:hypothetical protein
MNGFRGILLASFYPGYTLLELCMIVGMNKLRTVHTDKFVMGIAIHGTGGRVRFHQPPLVIKNQDGVVGKLEYRAILLFLPVSHFGFPAPVHAGTHLNQAFLIPAGRLTA